MRHDSFGGTGLGLGIVRSLAGIMGGRAAVLDKPGPGCLIAVDVPLKLAAPPVSQHPYHDDVITASSAPSSSQSSTYV